MGQVYEMRTEKPKKSKRPFKAKGIVIILLIVYLLYTLTAQHMIIRRTQAKEKQIQAQIEQITEENDRLKEELERTQSDEYIEKVARERLGLIKSGEIMFVDVNHGD